jgi:DNA-binding NtrC family response regulator
MPSSTAPVIDSPRPALIFVDDDALILESLSFFLKRRFQVHTASTRAEARRLLQGLEIQPSLALVDLGLPPAPHTPDEGFALITELLAFNPAMRILVLSGQDKNAHSQHALTLGAVDFITKPTDPRQIEKRLDEQLALMRAEEQQGSGEGAELLGESPAMQTLRALIAQFADNPFPVLIEGESGSGKELVAENLHRRSARAALPYVTINCSAFSAELLEAQLFGHAKGAYTGADSARGGFFEQAGCGTLVLDEIGEMPPGLQAKLLRVLESGEYYRIGETVPRQSKARIIAATNRDLREAVRTGAFRHDLYHRLGVLTINVPPLRERGEDALLLMDHFRALYAGNFQAFTLDAEARKSLQVYDFPGNIRELRNIAIRLGAKYPGQRVSAVQLEAELESGYAGTEFLRDTASPDAERQLRSPGFQLDEVLGNWERRYIDAALKLADGNLSKAARLLGVNRTTLYSRIERLEQREEK